MTDVKTSLNLLLILSIVFRGAISIMFLGSDKEHIAISAFKFRLYLLKSERSFTPVLRE